MVNYNTGTGKIVKSIKDYAEDKAGDGENVKEVITDIMDAISCGINEALCEFDGYEI